MGFGVKTPRPGLHLHINPLQWHFWEPPGQRGAQSSWIPPLPPQAAAAWAGGTFIFVLRDIYFPSISEVGAGKRVPVPHCSRAGTCPPASATETKSGAGAWWAEGPQDRAGQTDPRHPWGTPEPRAAECMGEPTGGQGLVTPSHSLSCHPSVGLQSLSPLPLGPIVIRGHLQPGDSSPQHLHP